MKIATLTVGPFEENCWILHDEPTGEVVVIDPGDEPARICAAVERTGGRLREIWLTHAHLDHIGGIAGVKRAWSAAPVFLHPLDLPLFDFAPRSAALYGVPFEPSDPPDRGLAEGDRLTLGAVRFEVLHLPGHSPGHVAFLGGGHLFSGDVLFVGSIGRTDLPRSDPAAMQQSLERLTTLPTETLVHPGHGPATSIGDECRHNPFLNGAARVLRR